MNIFPCFCSNSISLEISFCLPGFAQLLFMAIWKESRVLCVISQQCPRPNFGFFSFASFFPVSWWLWQSSGMTKSWFSPPFSQNCFCSGSSCRPWWDLPVHFSQNPNLSSLLSEYCKLTHWFLELMHILCHNKVPDVFSRWLSHFSLSQVRKEKRDDMVCGGGGRDI